jgi:hypothetical protein
VNAAPCTPGRRLYHDYPRTAGAVEVASADEPEEGRMVERRTELNRRYHRKQTMAKLKARLAAAKSNSEREGILRKIHILSPWWTESASSG